MDYDLDEATAIAKRLADRLKRDDEGRADAYARFLDAIEKVAKDAGFKTSRPDVRSGAINISHPAAPRKTVRVACSLEDNDWIIVVEDSFRNREQRELDNLKFEYDASTGRFETDEDDAARVPMPGERVRKRSAVAVVMDVVAKGLAP